MRVPVLVISLPRLPASSSRVRTVTCGRQGKRIAHAGGGQRRDQDTSRSPSMRLLVPAYQDLARLYDTSA
jgi:hypothetical protein